MQSHADNVLESLTGQAGGYRLVIDLLQGREQWYNSTSMDTNLFHFLRAEGLRIRFSAFPYGSETEDEKYHSVFETLVISR